MNFLKIYKNIDWVILLSALGLVSFGLISVNSFGADNGFFNKQLISLGVSLVVLFYIGVMLILDF